MMSDPTIEISIIEVKGIKPTLTKCNHLTLGYLSQNIR